MKIGNVEVKEVYSAPYEEFNFARVALTMQLLGWHPLYSGPGGMVTDQPSEQILRIEAYRMLESVRARGAEAQGTGSLTVTSDGVVHFIAGLSFELHAAEAFATAGIWIEKQKEIVKWRSN